MYQIDNSTAAAALPAPTTPGTPGYYTDGNPVGGIPATIVPAEHLNMMMMELINVILSAGATLDKSVNTQLRDALKTLGLQAASTTQKGVSQFATGTETANLALATKSVTPAGLASLIPSTLVPGLIKLASAGDAQGLSEATKALTSATLNSAFQGSNQSLIAAGGYQIFPGGLILQWGGASFSSTGVANVFPIAFPNAAFVPLTGNSGTAGLTIMLSYTALSNTGFTAKSSSGSGSYYYLALGH